MIAGHFRAQLSTADAVITAEKNRFAVPPLHPGLQTIELRNRAGSGRGFQVVTLNPGKTNADAPPASSTLTATAAQFVPRAPAASFSSVSGQT
jgi:hypothetical protein